MRRERHGTDISVSSRATNPRAVFRERVEAREAFFDDKGDRAKKESDIWWVSGEAKRKQIDRSVVCEWVVAQKERQRISNSSRHL